MAAATTEINTPERPGSTTSYPLAANTTIYAGTLVALNSDGRAVPAAHAAGLKVVGRAEATITNGATAGAVSVDVKRGVFLFGNSGTDAVDANDRQKACFVEDDNTVSETGGTHKVIAGRVVDVVAEGVWVDVSAAPILEAARTDAAAQIAAI
jgi:hypothetical protein